MQSIRRFHGLTFVELISTLAISGVILSVAVPSFQNFTSKQRIVSDSWAVREALNFARGKAVSTGSDITACLVDATGDCVNTNASRFIVFDDLNTNKALDSGEPVYMERAFDNSVLSVRPSNRPYIRFARDGHIKDNGNIQLCLKNGYPYGRQIIFFYSGRIRSAKDANSDGFFEDAQGRPIKC